MSWISPMEVPALGFLPVDSMRHSILFGPLVLTYDVIFGQS